jgi:hypothetical protein
MPRMVYRGQKLTKLVSRKTPAATNNTIPSVPEIVPVKYKTAITAAIIVLIILSAEPMFVFIILVLNFIKLNVFKKLTP